MTVMILLIGVSGSGKSTIGRCLAEAMGGRFLDADDFHPSGNIRKMSEGIPLTDADRLPWLALLVEELERLEGDPQPVVLACSALKKSYRDRFREALPGIRIVYLRGSFQMIKQRMAGRAGHFMKVEMLKSQFADLEEPQDALVVDINQPAEAVTASILEMLKN